MKKLIISTLLITFSLISFSQTVKITGNILDSKDKFPLPGANIIITDTVQKGSIQGTTTDKNGSFSIKHKKGKCRLNISFIGYDEINMEFDLKNKDIELGNILLKENNEMLDEINVIQNITPSIQKGDTTQFNALAFKTNPTATAKELVMKMPGFMLIDGKMLFQGEKIKEVRIDGKEFFGKDAMNALINIPVDIIKSIDVYEYQSEQSKFTGIKEITEGKTINIITKDGFKNLLFGYASAEGGNANKYGINASLNSFAGDKRISANTNISGLNSNGNKQNSKNVGFYFTNKINKKHDLNINYSHSSNDSKSNNESEKTYISSIQEGQKHLNQSVSENDNKNNRLNIRWDYKIDKSNSILFEPSISLSNSNSTSNSFSQTSKLESILNKSNNISNNESKRIGISNSLLFRHKFEKEGRTLSVNIHQSDDDNSGENKQKSETSIKDKDEDLLINRRDDNVSKNQSFSSNITLTEAISKNLRVRATYRYSYNDNFSEKNVYDLNDENDETINDINSRNYKNINKENELKLGIQYNNKKTSLSINSNYRNTKRENKEKLPNVKDNDIEYNQFSPSLRFNYRFKKGKSFSFSYHSSASNPSINELQEVVNDANALYISTGNSKLSKSRSHSLSSRYNISNDKKGTLFMLGVRINFTDNYIGRETIIAENDMIVNDKISLIKGAQFSRPVNMQGNVSARTNITYSIPLKKIKSKLNIYNSISFRRTPNLINKEKSFSHNYSISQSFSLASNISEDIDFTISTRSGLSFLDNSTSNTKTKRFSQNSGARIYWNVFSRMIIRSNISNTINSDLKGTYHKSSWNCDAGIGVKLFKNKRGEIMLTANDLFNNKNNIYHSVTDLYVQDTKNSNVRRYYLLNFSYRFR